MNDNFAIQLFEGKKVRFVWDEEQEKYYFAVVDIVQEPIVTILKPIGESLRNGFETKETKPLQIVTL